MLYTPFPYPCALVHLPVIPDPTLYHNLLRGALDHWTSPPLRYPHYLEKDDKPSYQSITAVGIMYNEAVELELQVDKGFAAPNQYGRVGRSIENDGS